MFYLYQVNDQDEEFSVKATSDKEAVQKVKEILPLSSVKCIYFEDEKLNIRYIDFQ